MKKSIVFILAAVIAVSFSTGTIANAVAPKRILITLPGWLENAATFDNSLKSSGWIKAGDKVIDFSYMNTRGTELQASQEALPRLEVLVNHNCFKGIPCQLHGISRGSDILTWVENQAHWPKPGLAVYLHNPGAGDTGAARSPFLTDPFWSQIYDPLQKLFGTPNLNAPRPTKNTQLYYNNSDAFANLTPLCKHLALAISMGIQLPIWHSLVMPQTAKFRVWYGPTGDVNHEYGHTYPSGADVKSCPAV